MEKFQKKSENNGGGLYKVGCLLGECFTGGSDIFMLCVSPAMVSHRLMLAVVGLISSILRPSLVIFVVFVLKLVLCHWNKI